jgi:hypothetical protein
MQIVDSLSDLPLMQMCLKAPLFWLAGAYGSTTTDVFLLESYDG